MSSCQGTYSASGSQTAPSGAGGAVRDCGDGLDETMVACSLARFGHPSVHVLCGGLEERKRRGLPVVKGFPGINGSGCSEEVDRSLCIEYDELRTVKDEEGAVLLDARPSEVYQAQGPWMNQGRYPVPSTCPGGA